MELTLVENVSHAYMHLFKKSPYDISNIIKLEHILDDNFVFHTDVVLAMQTET